MSARPARASSFTPSATRLLFGAMLVDALHAALEDREEAFDRVGMNVAAHIFFGAVLPAIREPSRHFGNEDR